MDLLLITLIIITGLVALADGRRSLGRRHPSARRTTTAADIRHPRHPLEARPMHTLLATLALDREVDRRREAHLHHLADLALDRPSAAQRSRQLLAVALTRLSLASAARSERSMRASRTT